MSPSDKPSIKSTGWRPRRSVAGLATTRESALVDVDGPHLIEHTSGDRDAVAWIAANRRAVDERLDQHGALVLRGFELGQESRLAETLRALGHEPFAYDERSSPRNPVAEHVYTSTVYPADQPILFHNENSYASQFPAALAFACIAPASQGGTTPLADGRRVLARLSPGVRERFEQDGVLYVRRHGGGLGLDWPTVYGSNDREEVTRRLRASGYDVAWRGDVLETRRVGPAIVRHPRTGERCWFNHATFFHSSGMPEEVVSVLTAERETSALPQETFFGDGSPIDDGTIAEVRQAYADETIAFGWQAGDVLLVDNILVAHARAPYAGPRRIIVALGGPRRAVRGVDAWQVTELP